MPPRRHCAILTCMDARLDPAKYAGLSEGGVHVIRNAGGWGNNIHRPKSFRLWRCGLRHALDSHRHSSVRKLTRRLTHRFKEAVFLVKIGPYSSIHSCKAAIIFFAWSLLEILNFDFI